MLRKIRYIFCFTVVLSFWSTGGYGQNKIDSLKLELKGYSVADSDYLKISLELIDLTRLTSRAEVIMEVKDSALLSARYLNDTAALVRIYGEVGDYYWKSGQLTRAAEAFNELRILAEIENNPDWKALSYNGLGTTYYLMSDYSKAADYYHLAKDYVQNDTLLLTRLYNNIANVYVMTGEMDSVFLYYHMVSDYHENTGNLSILSNAYLNLSTAYGMVDSIDQSKRYANLAIETAEKSNDTRQLASVYSSLGSMVYPEHPKRAITLFKEGYRLAQIAGASDLMISADEYLTTAYYELGMKDSALEYVYRVYIFRDSLKRADNQMHVEAVEGRFDWAMDELAREKAANKRALRQEKIKNRNRTLLVLSWIILASLIGLSYILYHSNKAKREINLKLAISNATKDRFFGLIAHDIRSPLSGAISLSEVLKDELHSSNEEKLALYAKTLHQSLNDVMDLTENLLQWAQNESGRIAFHPVKQNVYHLAENTIQLFSDVTNSKQVAVLNRISSELEMEVDKNMMSTIFRNLLSNSLKYTEAGGSIVISAHRKDEEIIIEISDTGCGIPEDQLHSLFDTKKVVTTPGTRDERGSGLGLLLCHEFVLRHHGNIVVQSTQGEGTKVIMRFPA